MAVRVTALAGGVGGAKLAHGLARVLPQGSLTVIVNTGDDFTHLGLNISPDVDTVVYTLAELSDQKRGWGRENESFRALDVVRQLGGEGWFQLGDLDLGLHLQRTALLRKGVPLSEVTQAFCEAWNVPAAILPMTDDRVRTIVETPEGGLPFQEYFVARKCEPRVCGFRFEGLANAAAAPGVYAALEEADMVILCPSNPWVSIDPILGIRGVRDRLVRRKVIAVSPIIAGKAVKGPAAAMYADLGIKPSALAVAAHYQGILEAIVIDHADASLRAAIETLGIQVFLMDTMMNTIEDRIRLAEEVINLAGMEAGL
ncbi:MAG: 2-phospho-L-lactate transferase [Anaerolineales bacterium]|nr:2-phospho-L-lactate transferase [Anaerolineales bacterium]